MKKIVLISIIFFALSNIKANEIDSLKQIISTLTNNTERVDKTNILSEILLTSSEYDSAISIMQNNIQLAQNLNYKKGEADAWLILARYEAWKNKRVISIEFYNNAKSIYKEINYLNGVANSLLFLGENYVFLINAEKASKKLNDALEIFNTLQNKLGIADVYSVFGMLYDDGINSPKALDYYNKAIKIKESLKLTKPDKIRLTYAYANLGLLYLKKEQYDLSRKYSLMALEDLIKFDDKANASIILNNLAKSYIDEGDIKRAEEYLQKSLRYAREVDYLFSLNYSYVLAKEVLIKKHQEENKGDFQYLDSATILLNEVLKNIKTTNNSQANAVAYESFGEIEYLKKNYKKALDYYKLSYEIDSNGTLLNNVSKTLEGISDCYSKLGDYENAYKYIHKHKRYQESLNEIETLNNIKRIESEKELEKQKLKNLKEQEKINDRNFLQYSAAFLFIIFLFLIFNFSGKLNFNILITKAGIFLTILLLFEFILVYMDPYIENWTGGAPAYKLIINASLAALIFPLHNFFEARMTKKKKNKQ